nr:immunoglobulin heavy chain junction region [Macaca mulatta]MOX02793.1 immunoglobulin heavy chain junction region [Macaca mulatta]MOX05712.1 immunoglobulin heavy chain junction region [Macaca mulatta]MOX06039.1 immunoglobulin heavy chain junction region [Macaca mulatta]
CASPPMGVGYHWYFDLW